MTPKIQGVFRVTAEHEGALGFVQIKLGYFPDRFKIAHGHRIISTDDDALRADDLDEILSAATEWTMVSK